QVFLLNFLKYIFSDAEKENNESKPRAEYSLLETKTTDDAQDIKDKDKEDKEEDKEDKKPEAKIEYSLIEENIVVFDGSSSSDEDGTIVSYSWDFGDGGIGSGVTVTYIYNEPGNYKVTLTVTDDDGAYKKDVANIKLKNKDNNIENISEPNEFIQSKEEEKKEDFKNLNNDLSKLNEKIVKSEEKSISIFDHLLQKLLNNKEDRIIEILDINVSSIEDLLNIEKIIKNYKVIAVIGFDEIIDLNYEKDIKQNKESVLTGKYPEFILNFWNNFKEFATLFN
ncbi:PKD domain-containing protein, partial [Candidatus Atribacteria bacterium 1244-E10-H5-B2]